MENIVNLSSVTFLVSSYFDIKGTKWKTKPCGQCSPFVIQP